MTASNLELKSASDILSDTMSRLIKSAEKRKKIEVARIRTVDRGFAHREITNTAIALGRPLHHISPTQHRVFRPSQGRWVESGSAGQSPDEKLRSASEVSSGFVLGEGFSQYFDESTCGNVLLSQMLIDAVTTGSHSRGLVWLLLEPTGSHTKISPFVADQMRVVNLPLPSRSELLIMCREVLAKAWFDAGIDITSKKNINRIKKEASQFVSAMDGCSFGAAENLLQYALANNPTDLSGCYGLVESQRQSQFKDELGLEFINTDNIEPAIGLDGLISYVESQKELIPLYGRNKRAKGLVTLGPPGNGKTLICSLIGKIAGLKVAQFDISKILSKFVGQTEERMARFLAVTEKMAPIVLWIDEVEKILSYQSSGGDGGVMVRANGQLMGWLSDCDAPVYTVCSCNDIRMLDDMGSILIRHGRFDKIFLVDCPGLEARREMFERWLSPHTKKASSIAKQIAPETARYTGADIHTLVKNTTTFAKQNNQAISLDLLLKEADSIRGRAYSDYERFQPLRRWAREYAVPAGNFEI